MRMRNWNGMGAAIAVVALVSHAAKADDGRPSRETLAQMGLGSLAVISDDAATSIRGLGYRHGSSVSVFGSSFATYETRKGEAHSENGYNADGKHAAKGSNSSYAGVVEIWSGGHKQPRPGGQPNGDYGGGWMGDRRVGNWGGGGGYGGGGGGFGGGGGGFGGGKPTIHATIIFAGGSSSAWAF